MNELYNTILSKLHAGKLIFTKEDVMAINYSVYGDKPFYRGPDRDKMFGISIGRLVRNNMVRPVSTDTFKIVTNLYNFRKYITEEREERKEPALEDEPISFTESDIIETHWRFDRLSEYSRYIYSVDSDEDEEDDDLFDDFKDGELDFGENEVDEDEEESTPMLNSEQEAKADECENKKITLDSLYGPDFNMDEALLAVPDIKYEMLLDDVIKSAKTSAMRRPDWADVSTFDELCMDVISRIAVKSADRQEAIKKAARQIVAICHTTQNKRAEDVHYRVLQELITSSDREFNALKRTLA